MKYERYPDELAHYGVLGMKWGMRRARKRGTAYKYSSHLTKKLNKKAEMAKYKGDTNAYNKYNAKAKASQNYDNRRVKIVKNMGTAETVLAAIANDPVNAYTTYKAAGNTAGGAAIGALLTMGYGSYPVRALVRRSAINREAKRYM